MAESDSILWSPTTNMNVTETWDALSTKREPQNELDKDAFLKLMMAQMQNQDPLSPMDNQQFLAQMAQFTSLEQMVNLNTAYSKSQAYGMLGKQVEGTTTNEATGAVTDVTGDVFAVLTKGSEVYLKVENQDGQTVEMALSDVTAVGEEYLTTAMLNSIASDASNTRAQGMVGKRVQALITDKDGTPVDYVEGVVDYVRFEGMDTILMVGNKEVRPYQVSSVADPGEDSPFAIGRVINVSVPGETSDSDYVPHTGVIRDVDIVGGKPVMKVETIENGETTGKILDVPVKSIGYIQGALAYVGQTVDTGTFDGVVESVVFKNSMPYFQTTGKNEDGEIETREISYEDVLKEK